MASQAGRRHPHLRLAVGDAHRLPIGQPFDYIVWHDLVGHLDDVLGALREARRLAHPHTRLVLTHYNLLWTPLLVLAEWAGAKLPTPEQNWLSMEDLRNLLRLAGFRVLRAGTELLVPRRVPGFSAFANTVLVRFPLFRDLALVAWFEAAPVPAPVAPEVAVTVVIPCRNEAGNLEACVRRTPYMGTSTEVIIVDGSSTDGTWEIARRLEADPPAGLSVRAIPQVPEFDYARHTTAGRDPKLGMLNLGKGDAVRKGFAAATGDVLMILDADMTVSPEDLPKFYEPLRDRRADVVNGVRLVYPIEHQAFKPLNFIGNKIFSLVFSWLLGQPVKDTLCGTKALRRLDYERIAANRIRFGDFDPFGDFDLLFGAADLGLRIVDMPIRYQRRVAGTTKVSVWRHGPLLVAMTLVGLRKLKWPRWRRAVARLIQGSR